MRKYWQFFNKCNGKMAQRGRKLKLHDKEFIILTLNDDEKEKRRHCNDISQQKFGKTDLIVP